MLALTFFISVFSTVFWAIYATMFVLDKLHGVYFNQLGLMDASIYVAFIILPIFLLWSVFGYITQYLNNKNIQDSMYSLLKQMKKNADYTDLVARVMLEAEQEIKDGFILNKFDIFIADMNEILAEIIRRSGIASSEQIEHLWTKVQNGGKWSFGKVLIEVSQSQSDFQLRIFNKANNDIVLAGSILEFAARYQSLIMLLDKHDKERVFLNIVETGVFGKIFSIIAPIADEVKRAKEMSLSKKTPAFTAPFNETPIVAKEFSENNGPAESIVSKLNVFKKKNDEEVIRKAEPMVNVDEKDPFTMALERSFGSNDEPKVTISEPSISFNAKEENPAPLIMPEREKEAVEFNLVKQEPRIGAVAEFSETQKTLSSLRREWEDLKKVEPEVKVELQPEIQEENFSYPFGNWTDEANYKK